VTRARARVVSARLGEQKRADARARSPAEAPRELLFGDAELCDVQL